MASQWANYGTLNSADMGWGPASPMGVPMVQGTVGPNQGFVAPFGSSTGLMSTSTGVAPAFSVLGMLGLLIVGRIVVMLLDRSEE